jgi:hypothetical protein
MTKGAIADSNLPVHSYDGILRRDGTASFSEDYLGIFVPSVMGYYCVEVRVWYQDSTLIDEDMSNNVYPRAGELHYFKVSPPVEVELTRIIEPVASAFYTMGQTVNIIVGLQNNGIVDISPTDNIRLGAAIFRYVGTDRDTVWDYTVLVEQAGTNEGEVQIFWRLPNKDLYGWFVDATGDFILEVTVHWPGGLVTNGMVSRNFTVAPGYSGTYRVGRGQRFETIGSVIDSLQRFGVTGPTTFELVDTEYNERSATLTNVEVPALDFRSKIQGVRRINDDGIETSDSFCAIASAC